MNFIIHAPTAAAIVLWGRNWYFFLFAATIGLWKNMWLDWKYAPGAVWSDQVTAAGMYFLGAVLGALGAEFA